MKHPRLFLSVFAMAVASCSAQEEPPPASYLGRSLDLLRRAPDVVVDQPGALRPGDEAWRELASDGWQRDPKDHAVAWAAARTVTVRLPVLASGDATLELELRGPERPTRVAVALNGQPLGELDVGAETSTHTVAVPAADWRRGDNLLSLSGKDLGTVAGNEVFFALAGLRYAKHHLRVDPEPAGFALPAGCSVIYRLEPLAKSALELAGQAHGDGRLELRTRLLDPSTGASAAPETKSFTAKDAPVNASLVLPQDAGVLELELAWLSSDPDSRLDVRRLGLKEQTPVRRPSVLFVSIDTLSAQHLSLYGYARKTTPNLEAFARDAVVFRNCRANAPWTIPSYMSQFTGLYPRAHMIQAQLGQGRLDPTPWETQQMAPSRWTLAEFFRAAGYRTAAYVDNPWLASGFGFRQGFDEFDSEAADIPPREPSGGIRNIVPRVVEWLDEADRTQPFFVFLQAFDPHAPYHSVAPWKGRFDGDDLIDPSWQIPVGINQSFAYGCVPNHVAYELCPTRPLPATLAAAPIATAYDEKILEVDETLATLFAALKQRGLYDDLLIVFSADHGESTTGHEFFFNHSLLYSDVLHVPLVVKLPQQERAGTVVDSLVQLVDLYPTFLELVRPDARRTLHGSSLVPLLRGQSAPPRVAFAEGDMMRQLSVEKDGWKLVTSIPTYGGNQTMLTHPRLDRKKLGEICPELATGFFSNAEIGALLDKCPPARKFITDSLKGPFYELYHVADDPDELHDLAHEHPERVKELLALGESLKALGQVAQGQAQFTESPVELSGEALEEMRALGYVGD